MGSSSASRVNKRRLIWLLLLIAVLIWGYRVAKVNGLMYGLIPHPTAHTIQELLEQRGHWAHNEPLLTILEIAPDTPLAPEFLLGGRSNTGTYATTLEDATFLRFYTSGVLEKYGQFVGVGAKISPVETPLAKTPVSKKAAMALARTLLDTGVFDKKDYEGLTFIVDEERITYHPENNAKTGDAPPENPEDGEWSMWIDRYYRGIRCMGMVIIDLDIKTGRIKMIANLPFLPPGSTEEKITEAEAIQTAKKYAARRGVPTDEYESSKEFSYMGTPFKKLLGFTPRSVLCWVVTFQKPEGDHEHPYHVMVDCRTGRVSGAVY